LYFFFELFEKYVSIPVKKWYNYYKYIYVAKTPIDFSFEMRNLYVF